MRAAMLLHPMLRGRPSERSASRWAPTVAIAFALFAAVSCAVDLSLALR